MHHTQNPAGQGGADCNAKRQSVPFSLYAAKNKARPAGSSRRLIPAASQIQLVHHYSAAGVRSWHVVVYDNGGKKSRRSIANFATKRAAIEQLGSISKKLQAQIVGRGSVVTP
jgi:hypothetical protein